MKFLREGDKGFALAPKRGRVPIRYEYRDIRLDSGVRVEDVLVGVDVETDKILTIPAQSTPKIRSAREAVKDETITVRLSRELDDLLWLISDHYDANSSKFSAALIRFYLDEASESPPLAKRLCRLSKHELAGQRFTKRITVRFDTGFLKRVQFAVRELEHASWSDLVRGAIVAAKEDVLEGRAKRRAEKLEAVASAI